MGSVETLNPAERSLVESAVGFSCRVHAATIARLYKSANGTWVQSCMGAATIVTDNSSNSHFLKVIDLNSRQVAFSQEIYERFDYQRPRPFFHTFEVDDAVAGFSFAEEVEAASFYDSILQCLNRAATPPPSVRPPSTTPRSDSGLNSTVAAAVTKKEKKRSKFGLGRITSMLKKEDDPLDDLIISEPTGFRHESSIGWSPGSGFEIRNIPPEWKKLFQAAGIKKSELKNAETAQFVMNLIEENGGVPTTESEGPAAAAATTTAATTTTTTKPPPPPLGKAPPPPPPNRTAPPPPSSGSPAPPPPGPPPPGPPPPASSPAPSGGGGGGRSELLKSIQQGTSLNHIDPNAPKAAPPPPSGLADTLARAMDARRQAIQTEEADGEGDSDWSDNEWE